MKTEANAVVVYPLGELASYGVASQVARRIGDLAGTLMQQHPAPGQRHHDVVLGLPDKSNHTNPLPDASQSGSPRIHALFSNICSKCVFPRDIYDGCTRKESGLALWRPNWYIPHTWRRSCAMALRVRKDWLSEANQTRAAKRYRSHEMSIDRQHGSARNDGDRNSEFKRIKAHAKNSNTPFLLSAELEVKTRNRIKDF